MKKLGLMIALIVICSFFVSAGSLGANLEIPHIQYMELPWSTLSPNPVISVGDTFIVRTQIKNNGDVDDTNVKVKLIVPSFLGVENSTTIVGGKPIKGDNIITLPYLEAGKSIWIFFYVKARYSGSGYLEVKVEGDKNGIAKETGEKIRTMRYVGEIDGECGDGDGGEFYTINELMEKGMCDSGYAIKISGHNIWKWTCEGRNGGEDVTCEAYQKEVKEHSTKLYVCDDGEWDYAGRYDEGEYCPYSPFSNEECWCSEEDEKFYVDKFGRGHCDERWIYEIPTSWCDYYVEHDEKKCYRNDVWWYDSEGDRNDKYDECGSLGCDDGECWDEEFEHDVSISSITAYSSAYVGEDVVIDVEVSNVGDYNEEVVVLFSADDDFEESKIISLLKASTKKISFIWTATTKGIHEFFVEVFIEDDEDVRDNDAWISVNVNEGGDEIIDGLCGYADGKTVEDEDQLEDYGFCYEGDFNNINIDNGVDFYDTWYWTCRGINGGEEDFCHAYKEETDEPINGKCGNAHRKSFEDESELRDSVLCEEGNEANFYYTSNYNKWYWTCEGVNGGEGDSCRAYKDSEEPEEGVCKDSDGGLDYFKRGRAVDNPFTKGYRDCSKDSRDKTAPCIYDKKTKYVMEAFCNNGVPDVIFYRCPNRSYNGVCLR